MINPEDEIYDLIAKKLRTEFQGIAISGDSDSVAPSFPFVSIEMSDNTTLFKVMDSGNYEVSIVYFDINIYSNKKTGRKSECRAIAQVIDSLLTPKNFRRMEMRPVENRNNPNIYRIFANYRVATDGKYFYRR